MKWFIVKMVFRIVCGEGNHAPQFDEQLRLIKAESREEAFHRSQALGMKEEEFFFNAREQLVRWQFISICEIYTFSDLIDGAEIYSRIEETTDPENYLRFVYAKAEQIRFGSAQELIDLVS